MTLSYPDFTLGSEVHLTTSQSSDARDEYTRRLATWDAGISALDRTSQRISNVRLLVASIAIVIAVPVMRGSITSWWLAAPGLAFLALVVMHARVIDRIARARRGRAWYEHGLARINGDWPGRGPDGRRFLNGQPFAADLDLFGVGSLFQLLDTTRTATGETTLAAWLLAGAPPEEIRARQRAVDELRPLIDFRESMAVTAVAVTAPGNDSLRQWADTPITRFPGGISLIFGAIGIVSSLLLVAVFAEWIGSAAFIASLLVQAAIVMAYWRRSAATLADVDAAAHHLALLSAVLEQIERQHFQCPRLQRLSAALQTDGASPSKRIAGLLRLISALDSTRNQIAAPFAWLMMLPPILIVAINRWHQRNAHAITRWLDAVGEVEAFSALATYAYEHPADPFPVIVEGGGPIVEATALGHPLIADRVAVRNDVALGGDHPHLLLVSGSNMSGKSTLLRAIGVNVVLGLSGAPVRAASLRLSPMALGTSLRIEDSLQAGHSRFYAEILRIRAIVDLTRQSPSVLFLLDEMLAGTNSHDRRIGAEAIIRTLISHGAIGLVTTHDLALADVVPSLGPLAANVHFEDRIEDGAMVFDYKMREGVVTHSNALALMRAIGLDV